MKTQCHRHAIPLTPKDLFQQFGNSINILNFETTDIDNIFISEDKIPYQGIRYQFSDSFIWKNKNDGALIEMKVPSQRLFYVPIKTD